MSKIATRKTRNTTTVKVIVPTNNTWHSKPSAVPARFNTTSQARRASAVRPELNSVSGLKPSNK